MHRHHVDMRNCDSNCSGNVTLLSDRLASLAQKLTTSHSPENSGEGARETQTSGDECFQRAITLWTGGAGLQRDEKSALELWLRAALELNHALSAYAAGMVLWDGSDGCARDPIRAAELHKQAADGGVVEAMHDVGYFLENGNNGMQKNPEQAKKFYERAVANGYVQSMVNLGLLLWQGEGVQRDAVRAKSLFACAAEKGSGVALFNLGLMLSLGDEGVERNVVGARKFYEMAVARGNVDAMLNLGAMIWHWNQALLPCDAPQDVVVANVQNDPVGAKELFESAAAAGDSRGMTLLAKLLAKGDVGVCKDAVRAKQLYVRAVNADNVEAMIDLGQLLQSGAEGVQKDAQEALRLYAAAAEARSWKGALLCGLLVRTGDQGVPRNLEKAQKYYEDAVRFSNTRQDRAVALTEYARFLLSRSGDIEHDVAKAVNYLETACQHWPYYETVGELINIYNCIINYAPYTVWGFHNPNRAAMLRRILPRSGYFFDKYDMVRALDFLEGSESRLHRLMRHAVAKHKSCLLLLMGAAGVGKTATLNSLRGMPFVSEHVPTELVEFSQVLAGSDTLGLDADMLQDLDFRENSFSAVTSRITSDEVWCQVEHEGTCGRDMSTDVDLSEGEERHRVISVSELRAARIHHGDVLENVRQSLTQSSVPSRPKSRFILCWDLGGHSEYEMAHSLFVARADILLFVVNLERVRDDATRDEEVKDLCYWMQLGFMLVRDPKRVQTIVVGSHRGKKSYASGSLDLLRNSLAEQLGSNVYDEWVMEQPGGLKTKFIAIENSQAVDDPKGSGLEDLQAVIMQLLEDVRVTRRHVPLRWLAVVDKLRRIQEPNQVLWTRQEVESVCQHFPGFPRDETRRNEEILMAMRTMTTMSASTSTVFFQLSDEEWVLCLSPERLVELFRRISGPQQTWKRYLNKEEMLALRNSGILSEETIISKVWGTAYKETEKRKIVELLCECDLIMRLCSRKIGQDGGPLLYGIPSLFRHKRAFPQAMRRDERRIRIVTEFIHGLPTGLRGGLISFLSRKVHEGLQQVEMVGADSTLLNLVQNGRVIVTFKPHNREIRWTCIGRDPLKLGDVCIRALEVFLSHHAHPVRISRDSYVLRDCNANNGCGQRSTVKVKFHDLLNAECYKEWVSCGQCKLPMQIMELFDASLLNKQLVQSPRILPNRVIEQIFTRQSSALFYFGETAVAEACKGLSRVLDTSDKLDIDHFGQQLRSSDTQACEAEYAECVTERIATFAVSYVHHEPREGRFKFSDEQWKSLHRALSALAQCGIRKCRIWLDQCLWLADRSQSCWAHIGIMPYVLWPVISLGDKLFGSACTVATQERMWPFVEELGGLWSLGVIVTRERRGVREEDGCREWLSYNYREQLEPEETMRLLLLNIYHGATDDLQTGWTEDVKELREMAAWNVQWCAPGEVVVGPDWRMRICAKRKERSLRDIITGLALRIDNQKSGFTGEYLEKSRMITKEVLSEEMTKPDAVKRFCDLVEWLSGNKRGRTHPLLEVRDEEFMRSLIKINVITTKLGEFQFLGFVTKRNGIDCALWLLVAMDGSSSRFRRGRVRWTKVVVGKASCVLAKSRVSPVVELVLSEQLGIDPAEVELLSIKNYSSSAIEWAW